LKPESSKPSLFIKKHENLPLSGQALIDLLQAVLNKGVPFRFMAKGFSMSPFIKDDDIITVSPLSADSLRYGQMVAFRHPETKKLSIHRIIKNRGDLHLVKGDNVPQADGYIPRKNIIGRVTCVERRGKKAYLGFGPEKILIAFLSSKGLFSSLMIPVRKILRLIGKKGLHHG